MPGYKEHGWFLEPAHLKMSWIQHQIQQKDGYLSYPPPLSPSSTSPYASTFHKESTPSSGTRISPAVLFIIVVLAVLFFISGLLHLLVRFLVKHPSSSASPQSNRYPEISSSDALQRQLQQLFHLHDSGLDQAFIDALPVFHYKEIVGLKEQFDCAVCLCEFSEKDKLRLLPMCSHAFHINCIDTWLLSNSTCPLCRGTLFTPGFSIENPIFDFDDLIEEDSYAGNGENRVTSSQKTAEMDEIVVEKGVFPVRLGKFRQLNVGAEETGGGETSSSNLDARRCYSMGSYQYVLGNSDLQVSLCHDRQHHDIKLSRGMEHNGNSSVNGDMEGKKISTVTKGESFSVSKIWQWSKKGKFSSSSDAQMGLPPSLSTEFPWMNKKQGT
ncbi:RING-H2 finger protein ATL46-like [Juglans microcarpa x Juglans regia]|uniref:RING-H2 finger protein ATL46-like n=1 Tax=Juglans microcarpa x Juglans regia TaxID=2249226 RepID=UPI001B7F1F00|nr:RING-H2 finger protein ATL46-like [Juglans microcarpa x Juglans regia]XP_041008433.1 RING-H2 finger protein ATL46-like [Juglans microcarpa x Juglans regia]XP_041008434.1 RING-H2 finger protein ATL46-like [Juglans microcarpa x Juglans regia]XP_041008436.1 RING-H2 finger protein ATL46-like [Juglans microcarpa x Juglans regia]XP_041008437.1 RING-H2 finger protein ATL46-like [Juglans microcarpa x Juglans regia]